MKNKNIYSDSVTDLEPLLKHSTQKGNNVTAVRKDNFLDK